MNYKFGDTEYKSTGNPDRDYEALIQHLPDEYPIKNIVSAIQTAFENPSWQYTPKKVDRKISPGGIKIKEESKTPGVIGTIFDQALNTAAFGHSPLITTPIEYGYEKVKEKFTGDKYPISFQQLYRAKEKRLSNETKDRPLASLIGSAGAMLTPGAPSEILAKGGFALGKKAAAKLGGRVIPWLLKKALPVVAAGAPQAALQARGDEGDPDSLGKNIIGAEAANALLGSVIPAATGVVGGAAKRAWNSKLPEYLYSLSTGTPIEDAGYLIRSGMKGSIDDIVGKGSGIVSKIKTDMIKRLEQEQPFNASLVESAIPKTSTPTPGEKSAIKWLSKAIHENKITSPDISGGGGRFSPIIAQELKEKAGEMARNSVSGAVKDSQAAKTYELARDSLKSILEDVTGGAEGYVAKSNEAMSPIINLMKSVKHAKNPSNWRSTIDTASVPISLMTGNPIPAIFGVVDQVASRPSIRVPVGTSIASGMKKAGESISNSLVKNKAGIDKVKELYDLLLPLLNSQISSQSVVK